MSNENRKYTDLQEDFYHTKMIIKGKKIMIVGSRIVSILLIITALVMLGQRSIDFIKRVNIFTLNDLIINGNAYLSFNDLLDIMDIKSGDNIFHVHLKKLKAKLELHPRIRSVSIKRELPDKIIINIVEREPIALVNTRKELNYRLYEIDAEGYVIGEFPDFSTYDLPVVTGDIFERIILGGRIKNKEFLDILSIVSKTEVKYYDFKRFIAEINIVSGVNVKAVTLYLNHFNTKVEFGENFTEDKLDRLNSLIMVIGQKIRNMEYIDFKYNEAVGKYRS